MFLERDVIFKPIWHGKIEFVVYILLELPTTQVAKFLFLYDIRQTELNLGTENLDQKDWAHPDDLVREFRLILF